MNIINGVQELRLCETEMVFLKANQLYYFTVGPNCKRCKEIDDISSQGPFDVKKR